MGGKGKPFRLLRPPGVETLGEKRKGGEVYGARVRGGAGEI